MTLRLAMVQAHVAGGEPDANRAHLLELVEEAAEGADVVVLPEALPLGWTDPSAARAAEPIPGGATCTAFREAARRHGVFLCAGIVERDGERVYNAAVLLGPDGELLLHHRKINELDLGHGFYELGDRLGVVDTPLGRMGLMVCADGFAQDRVLGRALGLMGAQVILSPSAWAVPADHDHEREPYGALWRNAYAPVCREHSLWIAGVSNVGWIPAGPWAGRQCIGCSLLVGPDGEVAAEGPYGPEAETIVRHELELAERPRPWHHPPDRWFRPLDAGDDG